MFWEKKTHTRNVSSTSCFVFVHVHVQYKRINLCILENWSWYFLHDDNQPFMTDLVLWQTSFIKYVCRANVETVIFVCAFCSTLSVFAELLNHGVFCMPTKQTVWQTFTRKYTWSNSELGFFLSQEVTQESSFPREKKDFLFLCSDWFLPLTGPLFRQTLMWKGPHNDRLKRRNLQLVTAGTHFSRWGY